MKECVPQECVPLWSSEDGQVLSVQKTEVETNEILYLDISKTPSDQAVDKITEIMAFYFENNACNFAFVTRHVKTTHLENISVSLCLQILQACMKHHAFKRVQHIIMQCLEVDTNAQLAANMFTLTTKRSLTMTTQEEEVQEILRKWVKKSKKEMKESLRINP